MSTTHTPGPWKNHGRVAQAGLPHSAIAAKTLIARVYSEAFGDEAQEAANARLIAAAPELLAALIRCEANTTDDAVGKQARAAISKATGRDDLDQAI